MNEPRVGDIWQWSDGEPMLLLRLEERGAYSADSLLFAVLELTTGKRTTMVFASNLMDRWRQLA